MKRYEDRKKENCSIRKRTVTALVLCVGSMALLSGCGAVEPVIAEIKAKMGLTSETETELAEGQRKAEIIVVSIVGNELTYREKETETPETETTEERTEVQETEGDSEVQETEENSGTQRASIVPQGTETAQGSGDTGETSEEETMSSATGRAGRANRSGQTASGGFSVDNSGEMPSGSFPGGNSGESPSGGFPGGNFSEMSSIGEQPEGMDISQMPGMDQMPEGMDMSQMPGMGDGPDMPNMEELFAEMAGETVYLPVSIKVHADNGKETTFSILEEGDVLQVLFETKADGTEVITEIWMEGTY